MAEDRGYEKYLQQQATPQLQTQGRGYEKWIVRSPSEMNVPKPPPGYTGAEKFYAAGTPMEDIGKYEAQLKRGRESSAMPASERFGLWTMRQIGKTAPFIAAAEGGAGLVPKGAPIAARVLASAGAQGLYAGIKEKSVVSGLKAGGAALVGEGLSTLQGIRSALKKGIPTEAVAGTLERSTAGRASELYGRVTPKQEADIARDAAKAVERAAKTLSPGRTEAEAAMAFRDTLSSNLGMAKPVDTTPIKQAMMDQIKIIPGGSPEQKAINEWMQERIDSLPPRMTHTELDAFIRDWSSTVKSTYGKAGTELTIPQGTRRGFIDPARALRDELMPEAAPAFNQAEEYMASTGNMRKMLVDSKGNVKSTAPGIWRQAMSNDLILQKMKDFESATGQKVIDAGMSLARKKIWNNADGQNAVSMLRAAFNLRTGIPSAAVGAKIPGRLTKMMLLGSRPLGAKAAQRFSGHPKPGNPETAAPEENFPGMTNIGQEQK